MIDLRKMNKFDLDYINQNLDKFDEFWTFNVLKSEFESEDSLLYVAQNEDEVLGFFAIKKGPFEIDIMNIVVRKDMRNKKIGSLLMEKILDIFKNSDKEAITLEVNENNIPAIKLYEKYGFEKVGIRKKYYGDDNAILMKKSLKDIA
ncbi:MAG: ribosomal protein S18-alanine N-acetyltransferase [Clostridia bacterium]|nr:ribosomal protein S18-alanine N-acetyltransferase [Clostridia bacterium]